MLLAPEELSDSVYPMGHSTTRDLPIKLKYFPRECLKNEDIHFANRATPEPWYMTKE